MVAWSALGVATVVTGVALGLLATTIWSTHDGPGSTALVATLTGNTLYTLSYGINLLIVDEQLSELLEIPFWFGGELMTIAFLFFALAFTGRGQYLTRRNAIIVSLIPTITVVLAITNSLGFHQWFWRDYHVTTTLGTGLRVLTPAPWMYVKSTYATILVGGAFLMITEEIFIERTLHRAQSIAIAVGVTIPLAGYTGWLLNLGPYPQLDLSPLLMVTWVLAVGYAVFVTDLFDTAPAVRRLSRRSTFDQLDEAIVIVTDMGTVIDANDAAIALFDRERDAALGEPISDLLTGDTLDLDQQTQVLSLETATGTRTYRVTIDRTTDQRGKHIGGTILLYDITDERQRKQRLEVLSRVLRHNLRNDVSVVIGFAEAIAERTQDTQIRGWSGQIIETATELVEMSKKARQFETAVDDETLGESVNLENILTRVVDEYREAYPTATIEAEVSPHLAVDGDAELVHLVVANLLENALEHHDGEHPTVTLRDRISEDGDKIVLEVADDGPGIPEIEVATLQEGGEEELQHSQGIGLWIVTWCVQALGGTVRFDTDGGGTTVAVEFQAASSQRQLKTPPA